LVGVGGCWRVLAGDSVYASCMVGMADLMVRRWSVVATAHVLLLQHPHHPPTLEQKKSCSPQ
jgi:hypothetical protein